MQVRTIGYGRSTVHDFESSDFRECCYIEATLESWEDVDESLGVLRERVCLKVGISEDIREMEKRREELKSEIKHYESLVIEANRQWTRIATFMKKLDDIVGLDPIPF